MVEINAKSEEKIRQAAIVWLTTVRADGMPQPTPVWFIWENGTFLIYSQPKAQKLRNIRHNPKVALNLNSDEQGEQYLVIMGEASIDEKQPPSDHVPAYLKKYRQSIQAIGYTPETLAQSWSVAIRVRPTQIHGQS